MIHKAELLVASPNLLKGLAAEDQTAIQQVVGSVLRVTNELPEVGCVELEFDVGKTTHWIIVPLSEVRVVS